MATETTMTNPGAREAILGRLRAAAPQAVPPRPAMPPLPEADLAGEPMVQCLLDRLEAETCVPIRVRNHREALDHLARIAREEHLDCLMASGDEVVAALDLPAWGERTGVSVLQPGPVAEREAYREAVFNRAQAAVTGVRFAVAETGSLALVHGPGQPRLLTLAPILHIVVIPVERVVPTLEAAVAPVFARREDLPSQLSLATGPSLTGDITGYLFRGMHGPRKVIAIVIG
jgi:L-lactate dehydrogenase complex protein LldG